MEPIHVPVLVVGGGPVGLTLAMDLAWRGVRSIVFEQRLDRQPPNPKCNTTSARSMEHFRRLGCADTIREAGLPSDHPTDVVFLTRWTGHEVARLRLPSSGLRRHRTGSIDDGWPTPEPQHRISQIYLEPILADHALRLGVDVRFGWRVDEIAQNADAVHAIAANTVTGERIAITADYLVGCDGGRSGVRRTIDARLVGDPGDSTMVSIYFRCPELLGRFPHEPAWMHFAVNPDGYFGIVALDGKELWIAHVAVPNGRDTNIDVAASLRAAMGFDPEVEVLGVEKWVPRRMVSDKYRSGRIFLAGDAAHVWLPLGGFGMNAGIGDAAHLAWMLAAAIHGWGGRGLLDGYEIERKPIGELVSQAAVTLRENAAKWVRLGYEPDVERHDAVGGAIRSEMANLICTYEMTQFNSVGVQLGYFYENSHLLCDDGTPRPRFSIDSYEPTGRPGHRVPHFWFDSETSLFDELGPDFTLIHSAAAAEQTARFARAAAERRVPLRILPVPDTAIELLGAPLVLVRPDQHVAWRSLNGNGASDPLSVIDRARGAVV